MKYVESITVCPSNKVIQIDKCYQGATATVCPSDADKTSVCWYSEDDNIASVNPTMGYIYGISLGTTRIYAQACDGSGVKGYMTVTIAQTVPVENITLSYSRLSIEKDTNVSLTASIYPEDATNKSLTWCSSNESVARVANGVVCGIGKGTATITATTTNGKSASCIVTVTENILVTSITVEPSIKTMTVGDSDVLNATVCPTNATKKSVCWRSDNTNVVTVNEISGLIRAQNPGTATVYATACDGSGVEGCCAITVNAPIMVECIGVCPETLELKVGESAKLYAEAFPENAKNKMIRWTSVDSSIAEVDSATGCVTAKSAGTTYICANAQDGSGVSGCCEVMVDAHIDDNDGSDDTEVPIQSIAISPGNKIMYVNTVETINAVIFPINATNKSVLWSSSDSDTVSIDSEGRLWAKKEGSVTLTAKSVSGNNEANCTVVVKKTSYYNIVNKDTEKYLRAYGGQDANIDTRMSIIQSRLTGFDTEVWKIDTVEKNSEAYIKLYIDEAYAFNVNRRYNPCKCDIFRKNGNEHDAAVYFIPQNDGYYKIKLVNYNLYLTSNGTEDGSNVYWQSSSEDALQLWGLIGVDLVQHESEKEEYHIVSNAGQGDAIGVYASATSRLSSDTELYKASLTYRNLQRWTFKGTGTAKKILTQHGDGFVLCNNGANVAIVSAEAPKENSELTITQISVNSDLYEIKLTHSGLYLTDSGDKLTWEDYNISQHSKQIWRIVGKPSNIHNGVDTDTIISNDITAKALNVGREEFVCRYYAIEENSHKVLTDSEKTYLHNNELKIVSVYQDRGDVAESFSAAKGKSNAERAYALATQLGQPEGTAIYFSVDYDPGYNLNHIVEYFGKIKDTFDGFTKKYKIGVYGTGKVCNKIKQEEGLAEYSWLCEGSGKTGYSEYDSVDKYNIKQSGPVFYNGVEFDDNIAVNTDYGQW